MDPHGHNAGGSATNIVVAECGDGRQSGETALDATLNSSDDFA